MATSIMATLDKSEDDKLSKRQKLQWLQKAVRPSDAGLQTHAELISSNFARDFPGALSYLSSEVSRRSAAVQVKQKERRGRQISEFGTGGREQGGGRHRGGRFRGQVLQPPPLTHVPTMCA